MVFITETECVYCAVRTGSLNIAMLIFYFKVLMDAKHYFMIVGNREAVLLTILLIS